MSNYHSFRAVKKEVIVKYGLKNIYKKLNKKQVVLFDMILEDLSYKEIYAKLKCLKNQQLHLRLGKLLQKAQAFGTDEVVKVIENFLRENRIENIEDIPWSNRLHRKRTGDRIFLSRQQILLLVEKTSPESEEV